MTAAFVALLFGSGAAAAQSELLAPVLWWFEEGAPVAAVLCLAGAGVGVALLKPGTS